MKKKSNTKQNREKKRKEMKCLTTKGEGKTDVQRDI
jgi:hypothetical protein